MGRQVVVGAVLVDDLVAPTAVLGARRTSPPELAGSWEFPGGKVEPGEAPLDALRRELREELSVELVVGDELLGPDGGRWPISSRLEMRLWLAQAHRPPVPGSSHDEVRWLTPRTWDDVRWLPADVDVLPALHRLMGTAAPRG